MQGTPLRWVDGNPVVFSAWSGQILKHTAPDLKKTQIGNQSYLKAGYFSAIQTLYTRLKVESWDLHKFPRFVLWDLHKTTYLAKDNLYGIPSFDGGEHCTAIYHTSAGQHYNWVVVPCYKRYKAGFICQSKRLHYFNIKIGRAHV